MSNPHTAEPLLALGDDELGLEAAKVLTPKPWEHKWINTGGIEHCKICREMRNQATDSTDCVYSIDVTDWNVAMAWFRKTKPKRSIIRKTCGPAWVDEMTWLVAEAQPRHYLLAAMLATEKLKE